MLGSYSVLPELSQNIRGVSRPVAWSFNGNPMPRTFFQRMFDSLFGAPPPTRWEDVRTGLRFSIHSIAAQQHKFLYTNTAEGWFFSPYTAPTWAKLLRGFGQFVEGSMFDWQIGDIYDLYNGCTAGDIRVRFSVTDPRTISVVGGVRKAKYDTPSEIGSYHVDFADFDINIMHAGEHTAHEMFDNETKEAYSAAWYRRFLCILSGLSAAYLLHKYANIPESPDAVVFAGLGLSLCILFGVWATAYGLTDWDGAETSFSTIVAGVVGVSIFGASTLMRGGLSHEKGL